MPAAALGQRIAPPCVEAPGHGVGADQAVLRGEQARGLEAEAVELQPLVREPAENDAGEDRLLPSTDRADTDNRKLTKLDARAPVIIGVAQVVAEGSALKNGRPGDARCKLAKSQVALDRSPLMILHRQPRHAEDAVLTRVVLDRGPFEASDLAGPVLDLVRVALGPNDPPTVLVEHRERARIKCPRPEGARELLEAGEPGPGDEERDGRPTQPGRDRAAREELHGYDHAGQSENENEQTKSGIADLPSAFSSRAACLRSGLAVSPLSGRGGLTGKP